MTTFRSFCSGIESASVAWHPLGWSAVSFSEIEPFCCALLAHHYPTVPNLGDMMAIDPEELCDDPADVWVAGTPCQSFSVAGLRGGLDDARGNLALRFFQLARRARPRWVVWENVPGVLSSDSGSDFGTILGALAECGYGFAYRVLDAQYFGLAQRRKRVFVVGYLGDWRPPAAVLFERAGLRGDIAPRREAWETTTNGLRTRSPGSGGQPNDYEQVVANTLHAHQGISAPDFMNVVSGPLPARTTAGGGLGTDFECDGGLIVPEIAASLTKVAESKGKGGYAGRRREDDTNLIAGTLQANYANKWGLDNQHVDAGCPLFAHSLRASGFDASGFDASEDGTGRGTPLVPIAFAQNQVGEVRVGSVLNTLNTNSNASGRNTGLVAFAQNTRDEVRICNGDGAITAALAAEPGMKQQTYLSGAMGVRRITPGEAETLMGFPRSYTLVPYRGKPAADGPRYRALGNSKAVPVVRWIGERIQAAATGARGAE